ncbi:hypothetical protein [Cytobacillus sp. NCCP-133]|uniref:hypothetical protein n=1 Tax=Cytobacillus sp. NCCP-133 TaxID=766848 RepID=UPI002230FAED|nr:hypothetical protein [Cytobacillus sp. NCCP-133]GLB59608.1 hypothetical protein NCCP133_17410 [Cytobacillus sp. NCCP-133]
MKFNHVVREQHEDIHIEVGKYLNAAWRFLFNRKCFIFNRCQPGLSISFFPAGSVMMIIRAGLNNNLKNLNVKRLTKTIRMSFQILKIGFVKQGNGNTSDIAKTAADKKQL